MQLVKILTFQNYYLQNCSHLYSIEYWIKLQVYLYYLQIFKIQNNFHTYFSLILDQIMKKNYKDGFEWQKEGINSEKNNPEIHVVCSVCYETKVITRLFWSL